MIDDKKIIGMLQAKALGCLDESDNTEIQTFIDAGYVFPWNELGQYQNTVSLLPLTLQIELPDPGLKDKVALKLIKLSEELKAKKIAEEELSKASESQEIIEEEIDEKPDEFVNLDEPFVEPPIEIETESPVIESDIKFSEPPNIVEPVFNLDDIELPGYEEENVNINLADVSESEITAIETKTENVTDNMVLESEAPSGPINQLDIITEPVVSEEMKLEENVIEAISEEIKLDSELIEPKQETVVRETQVKAVEETQIEEIIDPNKPDFTKRSVAEKAFKTLEQDFDRLKYHIDEVEKRLKRNVLIAYLIIAFLIAILGVFFFKFSSDINQLEKEIDFLKSRPTSGLFQPEQTSPNYFS